MTDSRWAAVDDYFQGLLIPGDPALESARQSSSRAGLPPHQVTPSQGKLLGLLARAMGARRILEIGTLGGESSIWLGRALPSGGRLVTLEIDPDHARVAAENIRASGLQGVVEVRVGPALETLPELRSEDPFDFVFIDADKRLSTEYFRLALELSHPGSVFVVDNVVRDGRVLDAESNDEDVMGVRRLHDFIASEPRVSATAIQTVGSKGWDGFTIALVTG